MRQCIIDEWFTCFDIFHYHRKIYNKYCLYAIKNNDFRINKYNLYQLMCTQNIVNTFAG